MVTVALIARCRYGRVNYVLGKRLELLEEVARLQKSMRVAGDVAYTCETAAHFHLYHVVARWEEFLSNTKYSKKVSAGTSGSLV